VSLTYRRDPWHAWEHLWQVGLLEGCGLICRISWLSCPAGFPFLLKAASSSKSVALGAKRGALEAAVPCGGKGCSMSSSGGAGAVQSWGGVGLVCTLGPEGGNSPS